MTKWREQTSKELMREKKSCRRSRPRTQTHKLDVFHDGACLKLRFAHNQRSVKIDQVKSTLKVNKTNENWKYRSRDTAGSLVPDSNGMEDLWLSGTARKSGNRQKSHGKKCHRFDDFAVNNRKVVDAPAD